MIGMNVHVGRVNREAIGNAMAKGSIKALTRAGAYMRGVARRKVRRSKFKSSLPGQSPRDHTGFKRTFLFSVDKSKQAVYIGPQRWTGKPRNAGRTQANTLEFGGRANAETLWFTKNAPKTATLSGISKWILDRGYGPLFMGVSRAKVFHAIGYSKNSAGGFENKKIRQKKTYIKKYRGKTVYFLSVKIVSARQAERAARNIVEFFGYPIKGSFMMKARPTMGPSLQESKSKFAEYFKNCM